MIAIRSPSTSASSMECVVSNTILPFLIFLINCHVKRIEYGSIPLVGSSKIITYKRKQLKIFSTFQHGKVTRYRHWNLATPYYFLSVQFQETISSSCLQTKHAQPCSFYQPNLPDHNDKTENKPPHLIMNQRIHKQKGKIINIVPGLMFYSNQIR